MLAPFPNFFQTKRTHSEIKAELLPAYFKAWLEVAVGEEVVLADLNAGTGHEANGEKAALLRILEHFQQDENATENDLKTVKAFLAEPAKASLEKLKHVVDSPELFDSQTNLPLLLHDPENQKTLVKLLQKVPSLIAADPLSSELAQEIILKAFETAAADLFLLFDYKKLEKTFLAENPTVFLETVFGQQFPEVKANFLKEKSAKRREQILIENFGNSFRRLEFFPVLFKINAPGKASGTTYLLLATRSKSAYLQAKEFLQTFSEFQEDGVPLFGVNLNYQPAAIPGFSAFLNKYSLENLVQELAGSKSRYHYQTIRQVYESHSPGTHYVLANYLEAFRRLAEGGTVNLVNANNQKVKKASPAAVVFYRLHR